MAGTILQEKPGFNIDSAPSRSYLILANIGSWSQMCSLLWSDLIVSWRAWVLFTNNKLMRFILAVLMGVNIGINVADSIEDSIVQAALGNAAGPILLDWVAPGISLAVNIFATLSIGWKACSHYRFMKEASIHRRSHAIKVLLLLIESGTIFCIIQSLYIALVTFSGDSGLQLQELYHAVNIIFFGIAVPWYPVAVIILVLSNNSPVAEVASFHLSVTQPGTNSKSA
ncbi:hypothetical protein BT96DRAFT_916580 [Gymnopus androsaceus JB14]|uniref:Uncharacterized protein n=1 Tax=Gymnopus androsaceus JB14 TaxID=1447944 RepID=A0A6A4I2E8_9AGAR|nr:hypothetical protein BT96DRAFT_916580 [Gymnopus androsaceus JB14]